MKRAMFMTLAAVTQFVMVCTPIWSALYTTSIPHLFRLHWLLSSFSASAGLLQSGTSTLTLFSILEIQAHSHNSCCSIWGKSKHVYDRQMLVWSAVFHAKTALLMTMAIIIKSLPLRLFSILLNVKFWTVIHSHRMMSLKARSELA